VDGIIGIGWVLAFLLLAGGAIGLFQRDKFSLRWLLVAAALVLLNDFLLTCGYGALPRLIPHAQWNWQGKVLALAATLAVASLPAFGWKRSGLTLVQAPGSLRSAGIVALVYAGVFTTLAVLNPNEPTSRETLAFQLTMPGLEEEPFFRGVLLLALDQAFRGRVRFLGVDWGWGAVLSCTLFGLAHAFDVTHGQPSFEPMTMAVTALPAVIGVWLRYRTGSLLIPVLMHNFGNTIPLIL
jgi:membrane protease YdiL (CAAX protease family)